MAGDQQAKASVTFMPGTSVQGERAKLKKPRINEAKIKEYIIKPINQKAKLPLHIDGNHLKKDYTNLGSQVYREQMRPLKKRLKTLDTVVAILTVLTIIVIQYEYEMYWENSYHSTSMTNVLRVISLLLSIAIVVCLYFRFRTQLETIKFKDNMIDQPVTLISTGLWRKFLIEVCINIFICPPDIDTTFSMYQLGLEVRYTVDTFVAAFCMLRLYTIFPRYILSHYLDEYSHNNDRTLRVCKMNGSEAGILFTLKAQMTLKPYSVMISALIAAMVVLGVVIRVFEDGLIDPSNRFPFITNAFWLVIETFTMGIKLLLFKHCLVGYGDIVPRTHLGRLTTVIACMSGVVTLALLVTALSNTTDFSPIEGKVFEAIEAERASKNELKRDAAVIVKDFLVLTRLKQRQIESKRRTRLLMGLIVHAKRFHIKRLQADELIDQQINGNQYPFIGECSFEGSFSWKLHSLQTFMSIWPTCTWFR